MTRERGWQVDHCTIYRWVQAYSPELDKRCRRYLHPTSDSWRVDEVYIEIKGEGKWLYQAVGKHGNTLDFLLSARRDAAVAKRFFCKTLKASNSSLPRVINTDQHRVYPAAFEQPQDDGVLPSTTKLRQCKYLNNIIEQDHRFIQRLVKPGLGFKSFHTARRTLKGYETMNMIRKGQVIRVPKGDA